MKTRWQKDTLRIQSHPSPADWRFSRDFKWNVRKFSIAPTNKLSNY
jgi:hypothetical protein